MSERISPLARAAHPTNPRRALARTLSSNEREVNDLKTAFSYHTHIVHVLEDKAGETKIGEIAHKLGNLSMSTAFSGIDTPMIGGSRCNLPMWICSLRLAFVFPRFAMRRKEVFET
jgi:hypothetical protein